LINNLDKEPSLCQNELRELENESNTLRNRLL
jgi:hypothetical protein